MTKYLVVALVIAIVIWLTRAGKRAEQVKAANAAQRKAIKHDMMVECAQCGVHLPRSEALMSRGKTFCSEAHRAAFERAGMPR
jgi:uncharacterized protein